MARKTGNRAAQKPRRARPRMAVYMTIKKATFKSVFLTGLLVLVPLAITLWVLNLVIGTMDQTLLWLPESWRPERVFGVRLPGLGAVLTLAFIFVVGLLTHNFIGQKLVEWWNALVRRIPIIGPLYGSIQQVSDTLLSSNGNAFRKALLIEYPRKGSWTIAFLTGIPGGDVVNHLQEDHVSVYVPTTPNPTSGFFLMVPKSEVVELDMTVDAALKYIVSMGVVAPAASPRRPIDPPL
ncbi:Uncharacterized membrane protein [Paraburkholderia lycopersici]|uniref:Uncharacterized membrane protein n=2 Tax=Paraburkholderia lycopersici TaxID=416944 RepID=A0A1G6XZF7_9BURK|nr:Uncharacterized membrane protein [Paraburkholderia lycopersici]